jgi:DNA-directed RNA polymerase specialized sigma subunit
MILTAKQQLVMNLLRRPGGPSQKIVAQQLRMSESAVSRIRARAEQRVLEFVQRAGRDTDAELIAAII